jgi:hypothetical protein
MPHVNRRLVHTRSIRVDAYARDDKHWDLVASIQDVKPADLQLEAHVCPAGQPVHEMQLTVRIDLRMQIVAVQAKTIAAPYQGHCDSFPEVYQSLVGLNLLQGFHAAVRERLGGTQGCTHITELASVLPTVAIQAFAGEVVQLKLDSEKMPKQLDRCRALRLDGPVVARLYPRWARVQEKVEGEQT